MQIGTLTGVGAAMALGSQNGKETGADLVKAPKAVSISEQ